MNGKPFQAPRWHRVLVGACYAFNFFAIALAIATLVAVARVMEAFRMEMREWVVATNGPAMLASFEDAVAHELHVSFGILAVIVWVASLFTGGGLAMLWKSK